MIKDHIDSSLPIGPRKRRFWPLIFWGLAIFFIALVCWSIMLPTITRARPASLRIKCASNLRQIGLSLKLYANEHGRVYPDELSETILNDPDLTAYCFVCPSSAVDEPAAGPTTQSVATSIRSAAGHHCSYFYAGAMLTCDSIGENDVLAFELRSNHEGDGFNVLFGDGHVDWIDSKEETPTSAAYDRLLTDYAAGVRPLRLRP